MHHLYLRLNEFGMHYILLSGADIGNRQETLERATELINIQVGKVIQVSSFYESAPWGFESNTTFLNQAILVESTLDPEKMLSQLQKIEALLGRTRKEKQWTSRSIDIDILCSQHLIHHSASLTIPHTQLHKREFALNPLCELVPTWQHPLLKKSYSELLTELRAESTAS